MKTLRTLLPAVLTVAGLVAAVVLSPRDTSPPQYAIVAPPAFDGVLMNQMSLAQQVQAAGLIVFGTVKDVDSHKSGGTFVTDVTMDVNGVVRGTAGTTLSFTLPGGHEGSEGLAVGGVPNFLAGEKVLVLFNNSTDKRLLRL
ncbi:MAG TPA: hypothetical protein VFX19_14355, partial [Dehalococcoidia bacterium]|nr:hypothetical protein [Dehalococcoidia bacterium]